MPASHTTRNCTIASLSFSHQNRLSEVRLLFCLIVPVGPNATLCEAGESSEAPSARISSKDSTWSEADDELFEVDAPPKEELVLFGTCNDKFSGEFEDGVRACDTRMFRILLWP